MGRAKNAYLAWARLKGPLSPECQELNRLFSQCVDGNPIRVPDELKDPPQPTEESPRFILDVLHDESSRTIKSNRRGDDRFDHYSFRTIELLLSRDDVAISEFELVKLAMRWCQRNKCDLEEFLPFIDFNSLSDEERAWTLGHLLPSAESTRTVLNDLTSSAILNNHELEPFKLHYPGLRWKRVFTSAQDRLGTFISTAGRMLELFHRKLIVIQVDERLSLAIYVSKKIERGQESEVDDSVRVFSFPHSQGDVSCQRRALPTKKGYRLYCDDVNFQLYERQRSNTWIFINRGPSDDTTYRNIKERGDKRRQREQTVIDGTNYDCRASVALNKMSRDLQRHIGRVRQNGILGAVSFSLM
jgi:regulator of nonsense transcripts 1